MENRVSIVVADDHPIFLDGLRLVIQTVPDLEIVGEAHDGETALNLIRSLRPAIAILDIAMPHLDGLGVVRTLVEERFPVFIIFLTTYREEKLFKHALDLGVKGYVLKASAASDLVAAIRAVARGEHFTSPALTSYLVKERLQTAGGLTAGDHDIGALSPSERRVLTLVADYKTNKQIADELHISTRTVEIHRTHICQKLGLHGTHALMKFALTKKNELSLKTD
jgi:DNA-binding NarL/FixJ family response regulator